MFYKKLFLLLLAIAATMQTITTRSEEPFAIEGMVGKYPAKIYWLIQQLNENNDALLKNCVLLYGPPGNGKTTLARQIAQKTKSEFLTLDGPSVVDVYVGQGARNIATIFDQAHEKTMTTNNRAIIFIDEIDAIGSNVKTEFRAEHKAALQQLWLEIDKSKKNPKIFIIFATNHLDKLDKTFLDRFGSNTIEIKNPDLTSRRDVLKYYFKKVGLSISDSLIEALAKKTEGLSIRSLEDLVNDIFITSITTRGKSQDEIVTESLKQSKAKFENNVADEEKYEKKLQRISTIVGIASGVLSIIVNTNYIVSILIGLKNQYFGSAQQQSVTSAQTIAATSSPVSV